jgi:NADH:ubiquinone oxidoreductase subunit F (NADH-binding)
MPHKTGSQTGTELDLDGLIDALEQAGLHGHGGAYFPTATKLRAAAAQSKRPIVVVNGSEGEPLSHKDRFLLGARSGTVLDGAFAVARALGADTIVIAVDHRRGQIIEKLETVLRSRPELSGRGAVSVEVVAVPDGYVTGQETALVSYLGGGEAKPTAVPPYLSEKGLRKRPTLVSNAETYAQIGRVIAGSFDASRHVTVSGAVEQTAVVQVAPGTTVADALNAAGGVTESVSAVLLGGYAGTWAGATMAMTLSLDEPSLRTHGLTLGAGIIHVLGESVCGVAEVARVSRWMAGQTAGQCGPCVFGLAAIAGALETLCEPRSTQRERTDALAQVSRWCAMVNRRGGCAHPDGVSRYVTSALSVLAESFTDHAAHGPCDRCGGGLAGAAPRRGSGVDGAAAVAA